MNGTTVEKYLWANLTTLLAVYDGADNLVQRFEYASNRMPVAMTYNESKYYLHYDQVGSLRAVSRVLSPDNTLEVVKEITYDTYGNIITDTNSSLKVPFGFAGGLYDSDTKLTRFGYRDYDAYTGKWTAKDPIGFDGGDTNLYGYVLGDPVSFVDSNGLTPNEDIFKTKVCRKAKESCAHYFDNVVDWCNRNIHSVHRGTICSSMGLNSLKFCKNNIEKIPICKEECNENTNK